MAMSLRSAALRGTPFQARRPGRLSSLIVEANKKVQKKTKVIITSAAPSLGKEGEILQVPTGFWRNYLLPSGIAKIADRGILEAIKQKKEQELQRKRDEKARAEGFAKALGMAKFVIKKKMGLKTQIYGSVTNKDISNAIYQQTGQLVPETDITAPDMKTLGTFECTAKLHPEVVGTFSVVIQKDTSLTVKENADEKKAAAKKGR